MTPLQRLVDELLARVEVLVERAAERMQEVLPSYAVIHRAELLPVVRENTRNILMAGQRPRSGTTRGPRALPRDR